MEKRDTWKHIGAIARSEAGKLIAARELKENPAAATLGGRAAAVGATAGSSGYGGPLSPTSEIETAGKIEPPLALLVRPVAGALWRPAWCYQ